MIRRRLVLRALPLVLSGGQPGLAQSPADIRDLKLRDWQPTPMLKVKVTDIKRAKFPAIDIHNHLGGGKQVLSPERVRHDLEEMDAAGIRTVINLDGGWGDRLRETIERLDLAHSGRFLTFAKIDFEGFGHEGWTDRELTRLFCGGTEPTGRAIGRSGSCFPGFDPGRPIVSGSDVPPAALAPRPPEESWRADGR
jgi:hypothetical protein